MKAPRDLPEILSPETVSASEQAFRALREQLRELTVLCAAMSQAFEPQSMERRIVTSASRMVGVDGCSLYRTQGDQLRFRVVKSTPLGLMAVTDFGEEGVFAPIALLDADGAPSRETIAARAITDNDVVNVSDVTRLPNYDSSRVAQFDQRMGYETRSILAVPVSFAGHGPLGVMQFVNAKNGIGNHVPFSTTHVQLARSLAMLVGMLWMQASPDLS